jgi:hypothetical protein
MATNNQTNSESIPMHKRIAMGEKLDGTSLQPKGKSPQSQKGGLSQANKK